MEKNKLKYVLAVYMDSESGKLSAWKIDKSKARKIIPEEASDEQLSKEYRTKRII